MRNGTYRASLQPRKVYRVLEDPSGEAHALLRVVDDSGEDYLFPADLFVPIELPAKARPAFDRSAASGPVAVMAARMTRDRILEALQDLPADATVDDAIERLVFLAKVDSGLAELDEGKGLPHAEVKQRLGM